MAWKNKALGLCDAIAAFDEFPETGIVCICILL